MHYCAINIQLGFVFFHVDPIINGRKGLGAIVRI